MATSMLRLGRLGTLKCLRQDGWGSLKTPLSAAFCTKTEAPKKPAKKASTLEAPDERAALLAYKTTVAFPTRLSTPGFLSQGVALEAAPALEPEPFDNSMYKNLQHHNYNSYTFVDMDVEMAKHRLAQPSTGRPSPQH
ncbi:NADH dehydrogenase [ubiquinone] flavoprotein 3, mitochondrial isoform X2 [Tachysurus fulvidraco]|uniref:NADH dehydrogenase [ubiquinone] flavoprotein 3, mitochondrial isoform X2 n=1 Tax=Tachysurus fulvidraco TaxID=1234273 RepID=UPI001FED976F|nr:NADH dehydrogenase [ubiquinone] flavoprotein 3, mitochondrial isoform X2 [Tachysurus fulvidraco]